VSALYVSSHETACVNASSRYVFGDMKASFCGIDYPDIIVVVLEENWRTYSEDLEAKYVLVLTDKSENEVLCLLARN
jgi:hypothetical protein